MEEERVDFVLLFCFLLLLLQFQAEAFRSEESTARSWRSAVPVSAMLARGLLPGVEAPTAALVASLAAVVDVDRVDVASKPKAFAVGGAVALFALALVDGIGVRSIHLAYLLSAASFSAAGCLSMKSDIAPACQRLAIGVMLAAVAVRQRAWHRDAVGCASLLFSALE